MLLMMLWIELNIEMLHNYVHNDNDDDHYDYDDDGNIKHI